MADALENGAAAVSHYSIADLGRAVQARLHFPRRDSLPIGSVGFVRSQPRALASARARGGERSADWELPWRDYPPAVLTPSSQVLEAPYAHDELLLSCRNVLNEWGYQIRLEGKWWRRAGDGPVDPTWPVLATLSSGLRFVQAAEAENSDDDILTGLPLVIGGRASDSDFLIANCSDVAHMFDVHPQGLLGPSRNAWLELSNAWQEAHDEGRSAEECARSLRIISQRHGVRERRHHLHSMIAAMTDGRILAFALTGPLAGIAEHLAKHWHVANAILLDNGGSVGWLYHAKDGLRPTLVVGATNRRENGTAFLSVRTGRFLEPRMHPFLA
jgi:hypothetical protein